MAEGYTRDFLRTCERRTRPIDDRLVRMARTLEALRTPSRVLTSFTGVAQATQKDLPTDLIGPIVHHRARNTRNMTFVAIDIPRIPDRAGRPARQPAATLVRYEATYRRGDRRPELIKEGLPFQVTAHLLSRLLNRGAWKEMSPTRMIADGAWFAAVGLAYQKCAEKYEGLGGNEVMIPLAYKGRGVVGAAVGKLEKTWTVRCFQENRTPDDIDKAPRVPLLMTYLSRDDLTPLRKRILNDVADFLGMGRGDGKVRGWVLRGDTAVLDADAFMPLFGEVQRVFRPITSFTETDTSLPCPVETLRPGPKRRCMAA